MNIIAFIMATVIVLLIMLLNCKLALRKYGKDSKVFENIKTLSIYITVGICVIALIVLVAEGGDYVYTKYNCNSSTGCVINTLINK